MHSKNYVNLRQLVTNLYIIQYLITSHTVHCCILCSLSTDDTVYRVLSRLIKPFIVLAVHRSYSL